jgi:heme exporter protein C
MWQWFHKLGSPRWFYQFSSRWLPWLTVLALALLATGAVWGLAFAPADARQGNSFRLIYVHVPASALAMAGYYVMAVAGIVGLIWRIKLAFWAMRVAAPIGAAMAFLSLVTGAIWGKPTWGTWWEWDARITSMLILFLLYVGVIALQQAFRNEDAAHRASAMLSIVGMVNIPIIYKSVEWWNTLHQGATLKLMGESSIHPSMAYPLLMMIAAFYVLYAVLLMLNLRNEILAHEWRSQWVRDLIGATKNGEQG